MLSLISWLLITAFGTSVVYEPLFCSWADFTHLGVYPYALPSLLTLLLVFGSEERGSPSALLLLTYIGALTRHGQLDLMTTVKENPSQAAHYVGGYLLLGFVWALVKFRMYLNKHYVQRSMENSLNYGLDELPLTPRWHGTYEDGSPIDTSDCSNCEPNWSECLSPAYWAQQFHSSPQSSTSSSSSSSSSSEGDINSHEWVQVNEDIPRRQPPVEYVSHPTMTVPFGEETMSSPTMSSQDNSSCQSPPGTPSRRSRSYEDDNTQNSHLDAYEQWADTVQTDRENKYNNFYMDLANTFMSNNTMMLYSWVVYWPFNVVYTFSDDLLEQVFRYVCNPLKRVCTYMVAAQFKNLHEKTM